MSSVANCSGSYSDSVLSKSLTTSLSLIKEHSPVSPPPSEESKTGQDALYSSGPNSTSAFIRVSKSVANGFTTTLTQELAHSNTDLTMPNGDATLESVRRIAPESMQYHSTVLTPQKSTEKPPTEPPKRTAAPESIHEDNSTVLNTHGATEQIPGDHSTAFTISGEGSSVTNSELIFRGTTQSASTPALLLNSTAFLKAGINSEEKRTGHTTEEAILKIHSSDSTMITSAIREGSSTEAMLSTSIYMPKRTTSNVIMEGHTSLQTSASYQSGEKQEQTTAEDTWSSSGLGEMLNASHGEDHERVKENLPKVVRKRSLAWKTLGSWSEHHPKRIYGYKLTHSYKKRNCSLITEPFCGFEHGFCGWKQSSEDDLDWRLGWRNLNANAGPFGPEGFHLSLKHSLEKSTLGQKALLLRPVVQPSNCLSFWYGSWHSVKGTLNVYIASSGGEQTLLWSSGGQDHAKWTKAQIMLPPPLLDNDAHVVLEGVLGSSYRSNIAIDDLYVGQCS